MGEQVILVVEDEVMIRMVLADTLRDEGYHVIEAANGDEGRQILLSGQVIDLMVTDWRMPGAVDGADLAVLSKQLVPGRPVMILSADAPPIPVADVFLTKPYRLPMLVLDIVKLIGPPCQTTTCNRTGS